MCNLYTQTSAPEAIRQWFAAKQLPLAFPEGVPNLQPRDIAITDSAPIVRAAPGVPGSYDLIVRRWSWPGTHGKPLYNFRSDGREFPSGRVLVVADGFYEFTTPADPKAKRKDRWLFTATNGEPIAIAGLVRDAPGVGEAFTLLTTTPGPDVAPLHHRQIVLLAPADWSAWLDHSAPASELLRPSPEGTLTLRPAQRAD